MVEAGVQNGASRIDVCGELQVRDRRKMLPSIIELLKGYLCSIFLRTLLSLLKTDFAS